MKHSNLKRGPILLIAAATVGIDQISKTLMTELLIDGRTMTAIPGLLELQLVYNTGAAFSLFRGSVAALALLSLAVSIE